MAISLSILIKNGNVTGLSDWFNQFWVRGLDLKIVIEHILLIVNIHTDAYNTVVWSLIHEMRISIIFPIIILCVMRWNWKINLIICFCLSTVGGLNDVFSFEERNGHYTSIFDTIHFTSFFILGSLIAKYRLYLVDTYKNLKRTYKWALLFISIVCYGYSKVIESVLNYEFMHIFTEYGIAFASVVVVVVSLSSDKLSNLLKNKTIIFIGNISYSLYLYHFIVLMSLTKLIHGIVPMEITNILILVISVGLATISYFYIEIPSANLGRKLASGFDNKKRKDLQYGKVS